MDNLRLADQRAGKGKRWQPGVIQFSRNRESNLFLLHETLLNKAYKTSEYTVFKVYEPKEREVYRLPYFPDRITHHAIMNLLEPIFMASFTADTYSCIKGKGIHGASFKLRKSLLDTESAKYCLKMDIKKFYPSIDHQVLKQLLRRKIKDKDLLWLLDEIIDSAPGLPIGNYLSQYFANFYLSYFDHWIKQELRVKYYFRYCDDLVFLAEKKPDLHRLSTKVIEYLNDELKLRVKPNYRIFPVTTGIDFVGYVHYPGYTLLRTGIKRRMAKAVYYGREKSIASYYGWAKHCNSKNLLKKLSMTKFSELGIQAPAPSMEGEKIEIYKILNKEIKVHGYEIKPSKYPEKGNGQCLYMQIEVGNSKRVLFSGSKFLMDTLNLIPKDKFPITTTIVQDNQRLQFT